jgi:hypothetical protein
LKKIQTLFGNYLIEMEINDFKVGDRVKYDGKGNAPKYLSEYDDLIVEKLNRKNVRVVSKSFPNEHWNIAPAYLKIL